MLQLVSVWLFLVFVLCSVFVCFIVCLCVCGLCLFGLVFCVCFLLVVCVCVWLNVCVCVCTVCACVCVCLQICQSPTLIGVEKQLSMVQLTGQRLPNYTKSAQLQVLLAKRLFKEICSCVDFG